MGASPNQRFAVFSCLIAALDRAGHRTKIKSVDPFDKTGNSEMVGEASSRWRGHVAKPVVEDGHVLD